MSGRRSSAGPAARRPDVTTVLAVLVPLLAVAAFLMVRVDPADETARPPDRVPLTRLTLTCPGVDAPPLVATGGEVAGEAVVRRGATEVDVPLRPGRVATAGTVPGAGADLPAEVAAIGDVAPGLTAARYPTGGPPGAPECREPRPDQWFTGVGASARRGSVLELTNPDAGPAVVDVVVHGPGGVVDAPSLRGLAVPGEGSVQLDLAAEVPRRGSLALHLTTTRGRVGAAVVDRFDDLGAGPSGEEWAGSQARPSTEVLLLGLPGADEDGVRRELVLANTAGDQTRVALSVLTPDTAFAPEGSPEVVLDADATAAVDLSGVLTDQVLEDAVGLRVEASGPVTAALRTVVDGDLARTDAAEPVEAGTSTVLLPEGATRLVVTGAGGADADPVEGAVRATARGADGRRVGPRSGLSGELARDRAAVLDLPVGTRRLDLRLPDGPVAGAVVVRGPDGAGGAAVVRLVEPPTTGLVGDVRPGLPGATAGPGD